MGVGAKCPGNAGECQGNVSEGVQSAWGIQANARECKEMTECMEVGTNCQGNETEWVQSARGMQGNARRMYGSWSRVQGQCR